MTMTTTDVEATVATVAYRVFRRYKRWIRYAPLWLAVQTYSVIYPEATTKDLRRAGEKHARHAKAQKCGYKPDDDLHYSRATIELLLPYALDPDAIPPPTVADEQEINRVHAGKEGYGGWESSIADIRVGLQEVSQHERNLLLLRHVEGCSVGWMSRKMGITPEALSSTLSRIVRRIQNRLGGPKP